MSVVNPFASYQLEIPKKYQDSVQKYARTAGKNDSLEHAPFARQVDVWFLSFLVAVNNGLEPVKEKDTYNATPASILDRDPYRISLIQLCALGITKDLEILKEPRKTFDYALQMANAGFPKLFQILNNEDDTPLMSMIEALEEMAE